MFICELPAACARPATILGPATEEARNGGTGAEEGQAAPHGRRCRQAGGRIAHDRFARSQSRGPRPSRNPRPCAGSDRRAGLCAECGGAQPGRRVSVPAGPGIQPPRLPLLRRIPPGAPGPGAGGGPGGGGRGPRPGGTPPTAPPGASSGGGAAASSPPRRYATMRPSSGHAFPQGSPSRRSPRGNPRPWPMR